MPLLYPPVTRPRCEHCNGTGFKPSIIRTALYPEGQTSGVVRCKDCSGTGKQPFVMDRKTVAAGGVD